MTLIGTCYHSNMEFCNHTSCLQEEQFLSSKHSLILECCHAFEISPETLNPIAVQTGLLAHVAICCSIVRMLLHCDMPYAFPLFVHVHISAKSTHTHSIIPSSCLSKQPIYLYDDITGKAEESSILLENGLMNFEALRSLSLHCIFNRPVTSLL